MLAQRSLLSLIALCLGILLCLSLPALAQEAKKEERLSGTIHMINKDTSTITLRTGNVQRQVVYDANTKFTVRNKPGTFADVKEGSRVICLGMYDAKNRLIASRVDVRQ